MKFTTVLLTTVACAGFALAAQIEQPPYSFPDYNKRFLENQLAPILDPGKVFYVSTEGRDRGFGRGTEAKPFASLEKARDAIRKLKKKSGLPAGGVHVVVLDGNYQFDENFELTEQDSGTKEAPIVYRGSAADKVSISGGLSIDAKTTKLVEDADVLARLNEKAHGKVVAIDVPAKAKSYFEEEDQFGMISMDGHLLTLAQWPNVGYYHIKDVLEPGPTRRWLKPGEEPAPYSKENPNGGKFTFREPLSPLVEKEFARSGRMQGQGYFHNDWYYQEEPVGAITNGVVELLHHTRYGIVKKIKSIPRRVRLVNVLAELDEKGEWYYDAIDGKIYVWPIDGFDPETSKVVALGGEELVILSWLHDYSVTEPFVFGGPALIDMKNTSYVTFRDMTFENLANQAISMEGGEYNLIAGCTIRNGLNKAFTVEGGKHNGITGCDIYGLEAAFTMTGGDFAKLDRCYNFVTNNDIHGCRRRGYGLIHLSGVGLYVAHNVFHDMNGAMNYKTVDSIIEYNEFYNIGYEMGDFNVAYCGSTWYTMDNVVRYNFVHHLLEPGGHPVCGFRNDDGGAGLKLYGNIFYRPGRGAVQFAGPLNECMNSITMSCNTMWWTNKRDITPEGVAAGWKNLEQFGRDLPHGDKGDNIYLMEQFMGKEGWKKSPWIDEYPELAKVLEVNPFAQTHGRVTLNYVNKVSNPFHIHGGGGDIEGMEDDSEGRFVDLPLEGTFHMPKPISMDAFVDVPSLNFNFKSDFKPMEGFKPIPFDNIGFVADEFRPNPPNKEDYRKAVYNKFKNDRGGRYNAEKVNARYPKPSYMK